jgi:hypothetical protein
MGGMGGGGMGGGAMGGGMGGGGAMGGGMGGGGAMGGRGGAAVDPATQIQTSLTRIQTSLGMAAGGEWTVLAAKIQKVLEDQQKLAAGAQNPLQGGRGGAAGGGRGGAAGGAAAAPVDATNPLAVARDDLSKAVAVGTTTDDAGLKTKMTTVRDQRKKLEDTLATDQKALKEVCSVRQEAILVSMGILN